MRYLFLEASWEGVALARMLADRGTLLSRCERPEDIHPYLEMAAPDLVVSDASGLRDPGRLLASIRRRFPGMPQAMLAQNPRRAESAGWLEAGAGTVIDIARADRDEVASRLLAVARRAHGFARPVVEAGGLRIDLARRRATGGGTALQLGPKLYEILEHLALRPGRLVTRDALLSHVYGFEREPDPRVFDVYICTLRNQLDACGARARIETARGAGFRFLAELHSDVAA